MKKEEAVVMTTTTHSKRVSIDVNTPPVATEQNGKSLAETAEQSEKPPTYKYNYQLDVGDDDEHGNKIEYIYDCVPGKYFTYHIRDFDFQIKAEDETLIGKNPSFNKLLLQIGDYLSNEPALRGKYITHIAHAMKNLYDGNIESAVATLNLTYDNITRYLKRRIIVPYLVGSMGMVFVLLGVYFAVYRWGNLNDLGFMLFNAVALSSLGGLLSIAISFRTLNVDVQDGKWTNAFYGFVRIVIAMISGIIMYFLIEGKVAFAFLQDASLVSAYYIAFFVAGFSEKLIANMMLDFENKDVQKPAEK